MAVSLSKLIALFLLCKYVNSLFLLMRARIHGGWPMSPALIIKAQSPAEAVANVHLAIMTAGWLMGESYPVCPPQEDWIKGASQTALGGTSTLCWAAMQSFIWKRLCQALLLFLEATVGHAGLRLDMEYDAVKHRELQDNKWGRFRLEPDRLNNILIPKSSDSASNSGVKQGLWTFKMYFGTLKIKRCCITWQQSVRKKITVHKRLCMMLYIIHDFCLTQK